MPITHAIRFFRPYLISTRRNAVKPRRIAIKMNGFATDWGSWNAARPAAWTGSERARDPSSTMTRNAGITINGMYFFTVLVSMKHGLRRDS